jgi:type I restriction enzyme, S subunit
MSKTNENKLVPKFRFPEFINYGEWEERNLSSIAENLDSKRVPITSNQREKGDIPYYGASGIIDYVKEYIYNENLLCISEDGANLIDRNYPIAFSISGKTWVNNHAHVLKFKNTNTQLLVETYINSINIEDFLTGMAQPKLNRGKLDIIPIPLPKNTKEQQKIAACLSSLDEVITFESQKLKVLKEHKKGLLQNLFPQAGETVPKLRLKEFEDSGDWVVGKVGDLVNTLMGNAFKSDDFVDEGIQLVRMGNLYQGELQLKRTPVFLPSKFKEEYSKFLIGSSDILMSMTGTMGKRDYGFVTQIPKNCTNLLLNQRVLKIIPKRNCVKEFILQLMKDENFLEILYSLPGGTKQANLSVNQFLGITISFPPTLGEQQKIAETLSSIDDLINTQSQKVETLKLHKKGLLQGLFPKIND